MRTHSSIIAIFVSVIGIGNFAHADGIFKTWQMRRGDITCHFSESHDNCTSPELVKISGRSAQYRSSVTLTKVGEKAYLGGVLQIPEGVFFLDRDSEKVFVSLKNIDILNFPRDRMKNSWEQNSLKSRLSVLPFIIYPQIKVGSRRFASVILTTIDWDHQIFTDCRVSYGDSQMLYWDRELNFTIKDAIILDLVDK